MGRENDIGWKRLLREVTDMTCALSYETIFDLSMEIKDRVYSISAYVIKITHIICCSHYTKGTQWTHPRTGRKKIVNGGIIEISLFHAPKIVIDSTTSIMFLLSTRICSSFIK